MEKESKNIELQILVEPEKSTFSSGNATERIMKNASDALSELGSQLKESSRSFFDSLEEAAPDEVELGLNLAIETEGRWFVVAGKAGATASVKLTWKR